MTPEEEIRALPRECQIAMAKYALAGWEFIAYRDSANSRWWQVWRDDDQFGGAYTSLEKAIRTQGLCGPLP